MMNLLITCMKTNDEEIIENGVTRMKNTTEHRVQARTLENALNIANACCMVGFCTIPEMTQDSFSIRDAETDKLLVDGEFSRKAEYWNAVIYHNDGSLDTIRTNGADMYSFLPL